MSALRHGGHIPPVRSGDNGPGNGIGVPGEHLFLALQMRAVGRFFGRSAQRLSSDSRAAAGLEIASCRGINQSLESLALARPAQDENKSNSTFCGKGGRRRISKKPKA